jgi:hypothetical protein
VLPIEALREPHYQVLQIWSVEEKSVSVFVQNRSQARKSVRFGAQGRNRIVYDAIDLKRFFEWLFF